jgi:hypothetical protein
MFNPIANVSKLSTFSLVGDPIYEDDLSSVVRDTIPGEATGMMIQAVDGDVYFTLSEANDDDPAAGSFYIQNASVFPILFEAKSGLYIAFLEKDSGAKITYQFVR